MNTSHLPGDMKPDTLRLCAYANRGDVKKLKSYIEQVGIQLNIQDGIGASAMILATENGHKRALTTLIAAGADVNVSQSRCKFLTPLMTAASRGHVECLVALLENSAHVNAADNKGHTPLSIALLEGYSDHLVNVTDERMKAFMGSPMMPDRTWKEQHEECALLLLQAGADVGFISDTGYSLLIYAAANGAIKVVRAILQAGVDINHSACDGSTALMLACSRCGTLQDFRRFMICVEELLQYGANVNAANLEGSTALILAIKYSLQYKKFHCTEILQLLLQAGANPNLQDIYGKTALIYAAERNLTYFCEILVKHFADVRIQDNDGRTAYTYVTDSRCLQVILSSQVLITILKQDGQQTLPHSLAALDIADKNGKTPLMYVAEGNIASCCELLLEHGAQVNLQNHDGRTALMFASRTHILQILMSHGANTDLLDKSDCSVLVHLLQCQKPARDLMDSLTIILESGANPLVDTHHHHLLSLRYKFSESQLLLTSLVIEGRKQLLRLLVCNGFVPLWDAHCSDQECYSSPLICALKSGHVDIAKYFISTCYLAHKDLMNIRKLACVGSHLYSLSEVVQLLLQQMSSHPWPLVKLAFIAVSSLLGASPEREHRISHSKLPPRLQRMLRFQEPVCRLPTSEWSNIQLCFDSAEYENMPKPRPLLHFWPVGRYLVI